MTPVTQLEKDAQIRLFKSKAARYKKAFEAERRLHEETVIMLNDRIDQVQRLQAQLSQGDATINKEIATIRRRWEATTFGTWITGGEGSLYENRIVCLQGDYTDLDAKLIDLIDITDTRDDCTAEDLIFIAEAHQDIPLLIREIERLQAMLNLEAQP